MEENRFRSLGRTGLRVGRLGVACSYGAPAAAFEAAFEQGVNYFYWGSARKESMARAISNIIANGKRDELVIVVQSYSRSAILMEQFFKRALKKLKIDRADILLLGWHNQPPSDRILERALAMRDKGMFRFLAVSGHRRPMFAQLADDLRFGLFHVRYNAAHRGAESEVFNRLPVDDRPGIVTYTATRWGDLLNPRKMPAGEKPLSGTDCYRFVISHPSVDVCMSGPKNMEEMRQALEALQLGPMSNDELKRVQHIGDHVHANYRRFFG
jgi:aryl-alcohol dehydrogenase-like predicted oxidoreductase